MERCAASGLWIFLDPSEEYYRFHYPVAGKRNGVTGPRGAHRL